jgi:hypothetical protein
MAQFSVEKRIKRTFQNSEAVPGIPYFEKKAILDSSNRSFEFWLSLFSEGTLDFEAIEESFPDSMVSRTAWGSNSNTCELGLFMSVLRFSVPSGGQRIGTEIRISMNVHE